MIKKAIAMVALALGLTVAAAGTVGASHGHYVLREDRDGQTHCRYIAQGQTSKDEQDPGGHKFHHNVHNGQPGDDAKGTDFDKSLNEDRCDTVEEKDSKARRR